jgi:hypothetical protein
MATFYEIYQNYLQNPYGGVNALPGADSAGDGGDGYATGGRIGYAEGGTTTYLTPTEFFETSGTRKEWAKILDELDEIVYSGQYANPEKAEYIKNLEDKKNKLYAQSWDEYYKSEADAALKQQTTPTEDFSDSSKYTVGPDGNIYEIGSGKLVNTNAQTTPTEDLSNNLNTTTINTNAQTTPTVAEQMMSPEDALTPPAPDVNPLQQHFDQNQMLKDAVASGEITPEQYNELGGYDVQQTLSPGNPLLGGIGNLIGSIGYNAVQSYKDKQSFGDAVGDVYRNVKGGLGLISPELKQTYQNIIQQRAPSNIAEHINTAISSFNPFQQQQYMNYAVQNPEQAIAAAQQNKDFLAATQKNTNPATSAPASMADGGRVFYLQGGLTSLLG